MPNLASALKSEIARIARKEIRAEVDSLRKAVTKYRSEIAALKRQSQALEQTLRQLHKAQPKVTPPAIQESGRSLRFSGKGLAGQRRRLGLSADACGLLIGASGQSIYNWETGKARPRAQHMAAIVAMRNLSKTQATQIVESRQK